MYYILYLFINYLFLEDTSTACSNYITQPKYDDSVGQWTGKFSPNNNGLFLFFPTSQASNQLKRILFKFDVINDINIDASGLPAFTINIFDSENITLAESMYYETTKSTYYQQESSFISTIFRTNRYFLGRNMVNNNGIVIITV